MTFNRSPLAIVWLKRDLRLHDHEALTAAQQENKHILLLYIAEPSVMVDEHVSERHLNFIKASLNDLKQQLSHFNTSLLAVQGEVIDVFEKLQSLYHIKGIYSHIETGLGITFLRDQNVANWCKAQKIDWKEYRQQGVFRGLRNRKQWIKQWTAFMNQPQAPKPKKNGWLKQSELKSLARHFEELDCAVEAQELTQPGGEQMAYRYLNSFFEGRYRNYQTHISKPDLARKSCSRLSPYAPSFTANRSRKSQRKERIWN